MTMRVSDTPAFVQQKLNALAELHDEVTAEADRLRARLDEVTKVVRSNRAPADVGDTNTPRPFDFQAYLDEFNELRARLAADAGKGTPGATHRRLRRWIEDLPNGTALEQVAATVPDGLTLTDARRRVAKRRSVIDEIRRLPHPSEDIERRIREYVSSLNTVSISGVEEGETLKVSWGLDWTNTPKEPTPLQVSALMHPDDLVEGLLRQVRRAALGSCPPAERPARIRTLQQEIEQLELVEEALVLAELSASRPVERRSDASAAAILGVKVAAAKPAPPPEKKMRVVA